MYRVFALLLLCACAKGPRSQEVRFFTWGSYDDPAAFEEFERKTGMRVVVSRYASNEEMLAKFLGGASGYDLVVPSDYMVAVMARQGLLEEIDRSKLPNLKHVDKRFLDLYYDRGNRRCVPYLWGVTGIAYDSDRVKPPPESWAVFWDPRYSNRISLLNDQREVFAMGLQAAGYSADTHDPAALERVKRRLIEQKSLVKTYVSDNMEAVLLSGEVDLSHVWSGDANRVADDKPSMRFAIPKEGGILWQDNLCIPVGAPNREGALRLMDFLMEPRIVARLVEKIRYGCPNKTAFDLLPKEMRDNPTIVPQDAVFRKLQWIPDPGEAWPLYDRFWTELKAS
ncbi:MAG: spermidine/putrescine ABC transporter substrate-binding protein [Elusimicrobia bacterium]|nr:spermidine/putrescine ABC transporter substrate-binding protein [Elusimicrobiota bacterium]